MTTELKLVSLFSDGMVLQRAQANPVWGTGRPGAHVTVSFVDQSKSTTVDADGNWRISLDAENAGGPFVLRANSDETDLVVNDVLVGEVWLASGQSNMEWPLELATEAEVDVPAADHPRIRLFTVPRQVSMEQIPLDARWKKCTPQTARWFSAVAYYFGTHLQRELDVPIGLIDSSWGGTPAEAWTPESLVEEHELLKPILERTRPAREFVERLGVFQRDAPATADEAALLRPQDVPGGLYNAMIAPLVPYGIRGAIWYQGESNAGRAYQYRTLLPLMIESWRQSWGQGDFAFLIVQLANWMPEEYEPVDHEWAELREAQCMALALPATGMAVIIDVGEAEDIHPRNKKTVGDRLALAARAQVHGHVIPFSGPQYVGFDSEGELMRLRFGHVDRGLVARGGRMKGFAIAGADRQFVWADAWIDGDTVVVHSAAVPQPVAVRYGWAPNPPASLYNGAGLPASPFRTDEWPGVTDNNF